MPKGKLTIASRKRLESRKRTTPFRKNSPVINQFECRHRATFCEWVDRQQKRGLLMLKEGETPQTATYLHFNYHAHARHASGEFKKLEIYQVLAELLIAVGRSEGLTHNMMVFYRYIASPDHSNLCVNYKSLKRQLQSMIIEY